MGVCVCAICMRVFVFSPGSVVSWSVSACAFFDLRSVQLARFTHRRKDRKVKLWSPEHGECLRTLAGHQGVVNSAGFLAGQGVGAPHLGRHHGERVHLLDRFEKGETLALFLHGCPFST